MSPKSLKRNPKSKVMFARDVMVCEWDMDIEDTIIEDVEETFVHLNSSPIMAVKTVASSLRGRTSPPRTEQHM